MIILTFLKNIFSSLKQISSDEPTLYKDLMQPSAQETGKLFARVPATINALFAPWDNWIQWQRYSVERTKRLLEKKLENVSPEDIVAPEPYVAIPAIDALSYSIDNQELREMYATLLSKAMYKKTKDAVHPAFIEVIKQMSPADAAYFKHIASLSALPIINIGVECQDDFCSYIPTIKYFNTFSKDFPNYELSISNLLRLGLIDIPAGSYYADESLYNELIKESLNQGYDLDYFAKQLPNDTRLKQIQYDNLCISITDFGENFYSVCVQDIV